MAPRLIQRLCHRIRYARRGTADGGFTIVEVMVSFVLFAIVAGGAVTGIVNSIRASSVSQQKVAAANVAQSIIASARTGTATTANGTTSLTARVGSTTYDITRKITFDNGATTCSSGATFVVNVIVTQPTTNTELARSDARVLC